MEAREIRYFWEDLVPGTMRELGSVTPTAEAIKAFAGQFDPQPFHLNEEAAKASLFGGLSASGWHTCCMAMRLMVDNFLCESSSLGSPGLENIKWLRPVHPGDTLRLRHHVIESRAMASKPHVGLVRTKWEMWNQRDEQVLQMEGFSMFRRRHPAEAEQPGARPA